METEARKKPEKIKLTEINPYLTCYLCKGYLIDATTISECLHSFCRSCIIKFLQDNSFCPVCEILINKAKPNLKLDKTLQDIVYKLVPELFLEEMTRRKVFYADFPDIAARVSPEERGEDIERTIFNPQDCISLSIEYISDDSTPGAIRLPTELDKTNGTVISQMKRYLQCPGMCRVEVLKKFVTNKYSVDTKKFHIEILYKRVPLPDHYTLIDIAYIYSWKRNEPMTFYFRITDINKVTERFDYFDAKKAVEPVVTPPTRPRQHSDRVTASARKRDSPSQKKLKIRSGKSTPQKRESSEREPITNGKCPKIEVPEIKTVATTPVEHAKEENVQTEVKRELVQCKVKDDEPDKTDDLCPKFVKEVTRQNSPVKNAKNVSKVNNGDQNNKIHQQANEKNNLYTNLTLNRTNNVEIITKIQRVQNKDGQPIRISIIQQMVKPKKLQEIRPKMEAQQEQEMLSKKPVPPNSTKKQETSPKRQPQKHSPPQLTKVQENVPKLQPQKQQDMFIKHQQEIVAKHQPQIKKQETSPKRQPQKHSPPQLTKVQENVPKLQTQKQQDMFIKHQQEIVAKHQPQILPISSPETVSLPTPAIDEEKQRFLQSFELTAAKNVLKNVNSINNEPQNKKSLEVVKNQFVQKRKNTSPIKNDKAKKPKVEKKPTTKIILQSKQQTVAAGIPQVASTKKHTSSPGARTSPGGTKKLPNGRKKDTGLKCLLGDCNINIPSSLSITLKETNDNNVLSVPPVKNFIEILKIPKESAKSEEKIVSKKLMEEDSDQKIDEDLSQIARSLTEKIPNSTSISQNFAPKQNFTLPAKPLSVPKYPILPAPIPESLSNSLVPKKNFGLAIEQASLGKIPILIPDLTPKINPPNITKSPEVSKKAEKKIMKLSPRSPQTFQKIFEESIKKPENKTPWSPIPNLDVTKTPEPKKENTSCENLVNVNTLISSQRRNISEIISDLYKKNRQQMENGIINAGGAGTTTPLQAAKSPVTNTPSACFVRKYPYF